MAELGAGKEVEKLVNFLQSSGGLRLAGGVHEKAGQ